MQRNTNKPEGKREQCGSTNKVGGIPAPRTVRVGATLHWQWLHSQELEI